MKFVDFCSKVLGVLSNTPPNNSLGTHSGVLIPKLFKTLTQKEANALRVAVTELQNAGLVKATKGMSYWVSPTFPNIHSVNQQQFIVPISDEQKKVLEGINKRCQQEAEEYALLTSATVPIAELASEANLPYDQTREVVQTLESQYAVIRIHTEVAGILTVSTSLKGLCSAPIPEEE